MKRPIFVYPHGLALPGPPFHLEEVAFQALVQRPANRGSERVGHDLDVATAITDMTERCEPGDREPLWGITILVDKNPPRRLGLELTNVVLRFAI